MIWTDKRENGQNLYILFILFYNILWLRKALTQVYFYTGGLYKGMQTYCRVRLNSRAIGILVAILQATAYYNISIQCSDQSFSRLQQCLLVAMHKVRSTHSRILALVVKILELVLVTSLLNPGGNVQGALTIFLFLKIELFCKNPTILANV